MAATLTLTGEHITASTDERTGHSATAELVRLFPPTLEGREGIFVKVSDNANVAKEVYGEVTHIVDGLMDGVIYESQQNMSYGVVSTYYESDAANLVVFIDPNCSYVPVARDVFGIATDHIGTAIDYGQIASVTGTNPYTITPENTFPVSYRKGSPVVFNPQPKQAGSYYRQYEGLANQPGRPAMMTGVNFYNTGGVVYAVSSDEAVTSNGSIWCWVSDEPFTPLDWRRLDGIYPDLILSGALAQDGTTSLATTMNGGEAIGTGVRYLLCLACANLDLTEATMAASQNGPFTAILGPFHASVSMEFV